MQNAPARPGPDGMGAGALTLLGPDLSAVPPVLPLEQLAPGQATAADHVREGRHVLAHGGPATGRTALALSAAAALSQAHGGEVLLMAPRRATAAHLRDALAAHGTPGVRVATPAALGYSVLRAAALAAGRGEPSLVTGAEQDALLADLIAARTAWHLEVEPAARTLPGFRTELRDVLARAAELGLGPAGLERLGLEHDRPAWRDAAAVLRDYLGVLDLESAAALDAGPRLDAGSLVRRAARLVSEGTVAPPARAVVVDDAQDLTAAGIALVVALAATGAPVLATSCPDAAVDTFRGALPDAAARLREQLPGLVHEAVLAGAHRVDARIVDATAALRWRLPLAGAPAATRRREEPPSRAGADGQRGGVQALRASDRAEEAHLIASALRDLHHREQIPYDRMAVVCRSGAAVAELADLLTRTGLPVRTPRRPRPLREEPVVQDLLRLVEIGATGVEQIDPLTATALLHGPFGDADALRLRRIRRLLLQAAPAEDSAGEHADSQQLLARALLHSDVPGLPAPDARGRTAAPVHRIRAMITAAREHREGSAVEALWAAWDASGLATGWRAAALGARHGSEGARARLAGSRLDALLELFAAAERLTDRRPGAGPLDLIDQVRSQAVVEDTLAPSAAPRGSVEVLTPAQIAGRHREAVVLARLQEGVWPDLRLRSTLLSAVELSLLAGGRAGSQLPQDPEALRAVQREQVIADELRLAVSALGRARRHVLVTAVEDDDHTPSALFDVLEDIAEGDWLDLEALRADPGPAPDPRRLVAALRRALHHPDPERARDAALALAALGAAGAPGAQPEQWYHQQPSSTAPLQEPGAPIRLSPSALERAHDCPQSWLMERAGGSRGSWPAQSIGTALHRLAQDHPRGGQDLLEQLHSLLRDLPGADTWSGRRRVRRAEDAAQLLAAHLADSPPPLAVEAPFEVALGPVLLRGTVDRIEGDTGTIRVVDLKTGRVAKTAKATEQDLQLAAYQAAVREGALAEQLGPDAPRHLAGAQLVHVGTGGRTAAVRTQQALTRAEDPAWFDTVVHQVATDVSGARVIARLNSHCTRCAVRSSCPLQPEGAQL